MKYMEDEPCNIGSYKMNNTDENYLKHIMLIHLHKGEVRQRDLVIALKKGESNVRAALTRLSERGFVKPRDKRSVNIELTESGRELAHEILKKTPDGSRLAYATGGSKGKGGRGGL